MGLIDGMLGDLIGGSAGIESRMARKMVRRAGMKNLLVIGGAVALAAHKSTPPPPPGVGSSPAGGRSRTQEPPRSGGGAPPPSRPGPSNPPPPAPLGADVSAIPPPPPPGAAPVPPPPPPGLAGPTDSDEEDETDLPAEAAVPAIRTMIAAALADGDLSEDERSLVRGRIDSSGLPQQDIKTLRGDLVLPLSPSDLARRAPTLGVRETHYRLAALVLMADGAVTDVERRWLERLAAAFDLPPDRKTELENEVFEGE